MSESTSYRAGFLDISESRRLTNEIKISGDLLIVLTNAEERCLEVLRASRGSFSRAAVLHFHPRDRPELRAANLAHIKATLESSSISTSVTNLGSAVAYSEVFNAIEQVILREREIIGRPLSIVVDISCLPKHYLIYTTGLLLKFALAYEIKFFYAEANYDEDFKNAEDFDKNNVKFSIGEWDPIVVPFFEGELVLEARSRVIALLGFETLESSKFIHSYQADQYSIVMAVSAYDKGYADRALLEGRALARNFDVPDAHVFSVDAGSVVDVAALFVDSFAEKSAHANLVVCLGPKPHALGAALHAVVSDNYTIICRVPAAYPAFVTKPNGYAWLYHVRDMSSTHII